MPTRAPCSRAQHAPARAISISTRTRTRHRGITTIASITTADGIVSITTADGTAVVTGQSGGTVSCTRFSRSEFAASL